VHEWKTFEGLADRAIDDKQNESVELSFKQTV
jgi:hypothetical protein